MWLAVLLISAYLCTMHFYISPQVRDVLMKFKKENFHILSYLLKSYPDMSSKSEYAKDPDVHIDI